MVAFWGAFRLWCSWCYIMVFMVSQYFGAFGADIAPLELVFAPIDSWDSGLSIGAKTSSDRSVDLELWCDKVGAQFHFHKKSAHVIRLRRREEVNLRNSADPEKIRFPKITEFKKPLRPWICFWWFLNARNHCMVFVTGDCTWSNPLPRLWLFNKPT